jgi:hypothetical protein
VHAEVLHAEGHPVLAVERADEQVLEKGEIVNRREALVVEAHAHARCPDRVGQDADSGVHVPDPPSKGRETDELRRRGNDPRERTLENRHGGGRKEHQRERPLAERTRSKESGQRPEHQERACEQSARAHEREGRGTPCAEPDDPRPQGERNERQSDLESEGERSMVRGDEALAE